jgi:hypothetical protein
VASERLDSIGSQSRVGVESDADGAVRQPHKLRYSRQPFAFVGNFFPQSHTFGQAPLEPKQFSNGIGDSHRAELSARESGLNPHLCARTLPITVCANMSVLPNRTTQKKKKKRASARECVCTSDTDTHPHACVFSGVRPWALPPSKRPSGRNSWRCFPMK